MKTVYDRELRRCTVCRDACTGSHHRVSEQACVRNQNTSPSAAVRGLYSSLNVRIGSTREARRAGRYVAPAVVSSSKSETVAKAKTFGCPRSKNWMELIPPHAKKPISRPTPTPALPNVKPCFRTMITTFTRSAPIAIRMPISRVRRLTE
jgi:hypothetical protein